MNTLLVTIVGARSRRAQRAVRIATWLATFAAIGCTSAWNDTAPAPFSRAETDRALAPINELEAHCYADSRRAQQRKPVRVEFMLYVNEQGHVHAEPVLAEPSIPEMIECVRHHLDALTFPAKGVSDQIRLQFEFGHRPDPE